MQLKKHIKKIIGKFGKYHPTTLMKIRYFIRFKKFLNLKNPKNLNEKILYLTLKTDTELWTVLADKYLVRNYVKETIGEDKLVKFYGTWDNAKKIDFNTLPQAFVLKTNHGSGEIIIVKDKTSLNTEQAIKYLNNEIKNPYGEIEGGKHYSRIKPVIIAEELLQNDNISAQFSSSIIDYKCWCFNGKCEYIWVCCNRNKEGADVLLYDKDWNAHPEYSVFNKHYKQGKIIPKPAKLNELINVAEKLANKFPCVRVDLYYINNKIYFGEMTFSSLGGLMNYFTNEFLNKTGEMIDLNYKSPSITST